MSTPYFSCVGLAQPVSQEPFPLLGDRCTQVSQSLPKTHTVGGMQGVPAGPGPMACQQSVLRCDQRMIQVSHLPLRFLEVTAAARLCLPSVPCGLIADLPGHIPPMLVISRRTVFLLRPFKCKRGGNGCVCTGWHITESLPPCLVLVHSKCEASHGGRESCVGWML